MNPEPKPEYVSLQQCKDRHATTTWMFGILMGLMAVFLTGTIYAVNGANQTTRQTSEVSITLEAHMAAQCETEKNLIRRLDEIKAELRDNRSLLNEILKNGKKTQ